MRVVALDELLSTGLSGESVSLAETLADPFAQQPGDALEQRDVTAALQAALAAMPERDRAVLVQSYIEGLTLSQIGQRLGVTESRVSQIRTKALREARSHLLARLRRLTILPARASGPSHPARSSATIPVHDQRSPSWTGGRAGRAHAVLRRMG